MRIFSDVWRSKRQVSWVDVGSGYGEVLEAVASLAPSGSRVTGFEPMKPKAVVAKARGLTVYEDYLQPGCIRADIVSLVDVFSHLPNFAAFLELVKTVLEPQGEVFIETGNLADLDSRSDFPGELGLPDHLVFAGETHIIGFLERAGFDIVTVERLRIDGLENLARNMIKLIIGRPAVLGWPYRSKYRQLQIRARLRPPASPTVQA